MEVEDRLEVKVLPICPQSVIDATGLQTFFCLCWTFKLSTVKEINLFLLACVSLIFLFLLPSVFPFLFMTLSLLSSVSVDYPLSCVPSSPCLPSFPPFMRRVGSGVTNYAERAEKVVWVLPSGLPCCIIIREIAGTQQPLAAGTTTTTLAPAPGCIDSARFKPSSCLSGWLAPSQPPLLLTCWAELICMSRLPGNSTWEYIHGQYVWWLYSYLLHTFCDTSSKLS